MKRFVPSLRSTLAALFLLGATAIVYLPGMGGDFVFDDFANIIANPNVQAESLDWLSLSRAAAAYQGPIGRPLATVGFALDYALGGPSPLIFKIHNLTIHLVTALLVFLLCQRLLIAGSESDRWPRFAAITVATLWAVHPLQVSSVLYIVQRMEMLSTLFVVLGLLAYLSGRRRQIEGRRGWPWLVASAMAATTGLLAKESAILFPLYALTLELTVLRFDASAPATSRRIRQFYGLAVATGVIVFYALVVPLYATPESFSNRDFTLHERVISQFRVLPTYLQQVLLPLPGSMPFYYDNFPKSTGMLAPATTLAGAILVLALLVAAWWKRHSAPILSLGIFWFFSAHALTSNTVNLELAFEHRNYFALLGVLLAVAGLIRALPFRINRDAAITGAVAVGVGVAALGMVRTATWGDPLLLAMEMVANNPTSPRASSDLGAIYARMALNSPESPFNDLAMRELERGARLAGSSPLPEQGLILIAAGRGQPAENWWWDSLLQKLRTRPIGPQESMSVSGLVSNRLDGVELDDQRLAEAYAILVERGGIPPSDYLGYAKHAEEVLGDPALATQMYVAAMASPRMTREYAQRILGALATDGKVASFDAAAREAKKRGLFD